MRIAYFWTAEFSRDIFIWIQEFQDIDIVCTVSQPDSPIWRRQEIIPTPLKQASLEKDIVCYQPEKIKKNKDFFELLRSFNLDYIVVVAYGKILPKEILDIPKYATINIHGSLLPKYRGASPIQASLKNGDTETWLTIMLMSEWMDEWDILSQVKVEVDIVDNTKTIFEKFALLGPKLLVDTLRNYTLWNIIPQKQDENQVTYCSKIEKEDGHISFQTMTAKQIYQLFQAYYIWPGIYTFLPDGKRLMIEDCFYMEENKNQGTGTLIQLSKKEFWVVCKEWILLLKQVKPEGKKSMDIVSFINGNGGVLDSIFN
jgi:methionyl-tRNA formyltransferase